jgi:hypothetical protein
VSAAAAQAASRLGHSGWNAYSVNLDYRTGSHVDGKNVPGSLSALLVLETGAPFAGGLYMLPTYHVGIVVRQGIVLFHRSGDPDVGCALRCIALRCVLCPYVPVCCGGCCLFQCCMGGLVSNSASRCDDSLSSADRQCATQR